MTEETLPAARAKTPWHLWVVGVVSALWNGFGVYDYLCTKMQGEAYLSGMGMTEAQIAHYAAYPFWMNAAWAIGVWGSLIGSLLLLARSKFAFHAFVLSAIGFAASLVYNYAITNGGELYGQTATIMNTVIAAIILALIFYSRGMAKRGVLR
ncbi:MAG: hypothetical protein IT546_15805 [Caulobacteraceae bacterium]|nr:hypothetical protein [Caulobacteraceae bacterium]